MFYLRCLSPNQYFIEKAVINRSDDADFTMDCDTDSDLTDIGGEIEESNSDSSVYD